MKKKSGNKKRVKHTREARARSSRAWMWAIVPVVAVVALAWGKRENPAAGRSEVVPSSTVNSSVSREVVRVPPFYKNAGAAKPFPRTLSPSFFQDAPVIRAYRIAEEIPEVLVQQPCYCWCEGYGHGSLLDCFTDGHGAGCSVCVNEATLASQMTDAGKTPAEIRQAIIRGDWRSVNVR